VPTPPHALPALPAFPAHLHQGFAGAPGQV
jgi:hypothetical protein